MRILAPRLENRRAVRLAVATLPAHRPSRKAFSGFTTFHTPSIVRSAAQTGDELDLKDEPTQG
jgi:hypothetical protein